MADFSNDLTVYDLANIIDKATTLIWTDISSQVGSRKIYVVYTPATSFDAYDGTIVVTNYDTDVEVYNLNTRNTKSITICNEGDTDCH